MKKIIVSLLLSCAGCSLHLQGMETATTNNATQTTNEDLLRQYNIGTQSLQQDMLAIIKELCDAKGQHINQKDISKLIPQAQTMLVNMTLDLAKARNQKDYSIETLKEKYNELYTLMGHISSLITGDPVPCNKTEECENLLVAKFKEKYALVNAIRDTDYPRIKKQIDLMIVDAERTKDNEGARQLNRCIGDLETHLGLTRTLLYNEGIQQSMEQLSQNTGDQAALETYLKSKITENILSQLDDPIRFMQLANETVARLSKTTPSTTTTVTTSATQPTRKAQAGITKTYHVPYLSFAPITGFFNRIRNLVYPTTPTVIIKTDALNYSQSDASTTSDESLMRKTVAEAQLNLLLRGEKPNIEQFSSQNLRYITSAARSRRLSLVPSILLGIRSQHLLSKMQFKHPVALAAAATVAGFCIFHKTFSYLTNYLIERSENENQIAKANQQTLLNYNRDYDKLLNTVRLDFNPNS